MIGAHRITSDSIADYAMRPCFGKAFVRMVPKP